MGARIRYSDLSGPVKDAVDAQLALQDRRAAPGLVNTRVGPLQPVTATQDQKESQRQPAGPNKTEAHYKAHHLRGKDARFEALTFRMDNGLRYTPDWVEFEEGKPTHCHECKGPHRHHSHQRARLAFLQCSREFPGLQWTWATKEPDGWRIEHA